MKRILKLVCATMIAGMFLASCASTPKKEKTSTTKESKKNNKKGSKKSKKAAYDQAVFDEAYANGDYAACLEMLNIRESDQILTGLDSSMILYLNKDYMGSAKGFVQTQQNMQSVTKDMTVGKIMEAALLGENSVEYSGTPYERILAYSMKAVDAIQMGEIDRAIGVMNEYTGNYKEEIAALIQQQKEIAAQSEGVLEKEEVKKSIDALKLAGIDVGLDKITKAPKSSSSFYDNSAFLAYLGTLSYAANEDPDHAKDFALVLKTANSKIDVSEDLDIPSGKGRLDVIALSDVIGKRTQASNEFVVGQVEDVIVRFKIAYPEFKESAHPVQVKKVTLSNGDSKNFTLIEDFDEAVKNDVESKARGAYNRSIFRNIVKNSAAVATGVASLESAKQVKSQAKNPLQVKAADLAYDAAVVGVNTALAAIVDAEKADVRQGAYFPNKASTAGFTVEPGTYTATVEYENGASDVIEGIVVTAGKPTIVVAQRNK